MARHGCLSFGVKRYLCFHRGGRYGLKHRIGPVTRIPLFLRCNACVSFFAGSRKEQGCIRCHGLVLAIYTYMRCRRPCRLSYQSASKWAHVWGRVWEETSTQTRKKACHVPPLLHFRARSKSALYCSKLLRLVVVGRGRCRACAARRVSRFEYMPLPLPSWPDAAPMSTGLP